MDVSSDEIEKHLKKLKLEKAEIEKELSQLVKSKETDDKTEMKIWELSIKLDDIGDEIKITYLRDGKERSGKATLKESQ